MHVLLQSQQKRCLTNRKLFSSLFLLASSSYLRSTLTYAGVALAAGSFAVVLWLAGFLTPLQQVFVFLPKSHEAMLLVPNLWTISALIFASSLMSAMVVGRFGGRRAFP